MKKIIVDEDTCIGCGFCCASCPEVFDMNDDGYAYTKDNNLDNMDESVKENALEVKEGCPVEAIKVIEE